MATARTGGRARKSAAAERQSRLNTITPDSLRSMAEKLADRRKALLNLLTEMDKLREDGGPEAVTVDGFRKFERALKELDGFKANLGRAIDLARSA